MFTPHWLLLVGIFLLPTKMSVTTAHGSAHGITWKTRESQSYQQFEVLFIRTRN